MRRVFAVTASVLLAWLAASCGGGGYKILVVIDPQSWELGVNETKQFTAYSTALYDPTVTWSVRETGGGTITPSGLYTAPNTPGVYHVVARSNEDPEASATAQVIVRSQP